jgi:peptidoglycan/xylan/chitin deacetylase (PgdA/CDA1 family)
MNRTFAKNSLYHTLNYAGVTKFARRKHREQVVILTYHGVLESGSESYVNRNCVSAAMFDLQMQWLKKNYRVLAISEILNALAGKKELPPYAAGITFDDGFRNNYTVAFPILLKYNLPAAIFVTTDFIGQANRKLWTERVDAMIQSTTTRRLSVQMNGDFTTFDVSNKDAKELASDHIRKYLKSLNPAARERKIIALEMQVENPRDCIDEVEERYAFLSWDEVKTMSEGGIEIGSHTASHAILATLAPEEAEREMQKSKNEIEAQVQKHCDLFSYPNGTKKDFTARDQGMLQKLGYRAAFSQINGFNTVGDDLYRLKRINIARSKNFSFFLAKITGVQPMIKRYV